MKKRVLSYASVVLAGILLLSSPVMAQVPVPASNPDIPLTTGNVTDARNVNCDMFFHAIGGGHLRAVAYDDYNTNTSYIHLEDYSGGTTTIMIPGARDIDIALGDDWANPGNDFIVLAVYNSGTTATLEGWSISGTGSGGLTANPTGAASLPALATGQSYMPPHIDMYPDPGNPIPVNGLPSYHEFGVTWAEYNGASGYDVYATNGDNSSIGGWGTTYSVTSGGDGTWPDIACLWDFSANEPFAYVTYRNSAGDIDLWEANLATTGNGLIAGGVNGGIPTEKSVRIEAMGLYDPGAGLQKYQLAFTAHTGSGILDMFSYNDIAGLFNLSAAGSGLSGGHNIHPAVAAGPGMLLNGGYSNENYTVGWYNDGTPNYFAQAIEAGSGNVNGGFPDYYEVNQNPVPHIVLDAYYAPLAVSTSTNWGENELLTAWYNDNDVYYKYQGDIQQYKPTSVKNVSKANYRLYPNPAATIITVDGVQKAGYTITDITGRMLLKGELAKGNSTINIEHLTKGMYVATITENGQSKALKFVKQ